jgi:magnesium-transporting ATPase (P-type)
MLAQMKSKSSKVPIYDIVRWCELEVGDIVFLKKHEVAPADLLILDISDRTCLILN